MHRLLTHVWLKPASFGTVQTSPSDLLYPENRGMHRLLTRAWLRKAYFHSFGCSNIQTSFPTGVLDTETREMRGYLTHAWLKPASFDCSNIKTWSTSNLLCPETREMRRLLTHAWLKPASFDYSNIQTVIHFRSIIYRNWRDRHISNLWRALALKRNYSCFKQYKAPILYIFF